MHHDPDHRLAGKIEECACFFQKKATQIRNETREKLQRMQWTFASMQRLGEQHPNNVWIDARLQEAKHKLDMYKKLSTTNANRSKATSRMRVG